MQQFSQSQALIGLLLNVIFIAFIATGIFVALSILQLDKAVTSLLAGAGIIGLALGFAFQDIAANFVSGVLMAIRRPVRLGDVIESNSYFGIKGGEKLNEQLEVITHHSQENGKVK